MIKSYRVTSSHIATFKNETIYNFLEYSLLPKNYYRTDIPDMYQGLVMPIHNCAHMWVTKGAHQRLCFNDGCQVATPHPREFLSSNGYGYVVDKCIVCPGVSM